MPSIGQDLAEELTRKLELSTGSGQSNQSAVPPLPVLEDGGATSGSSGGYLTPRDSATPPPRELANGSSNTTPTANEHRHVKGIKAEWQEFVKNGPQEKSELPKQEEFRVTPIKVTPIRFADSFDNLSDAEEK